MPWTLPRPPFVSRSLESLVNQTLLRVRLTPFGEMALLFYPPDT